MGPKSLAKLVVAGLTLLGVLTIPWLLGTYIAMTDEDFPVVDRGKKYTEVVLGIYGDKAFLGWVEDDAIRQVEMVAVSDLEGKPIWTAYGIGPLRCEPYDL